MQSYARYLCYVAQKNSDAVCPDYTLPPRPAPPPASPFKSLPALWSSELESWTAFDSCLSWDHPMLVTFMLQDKTQGLGLNIRSVLLSGLTFQFLLRFSNLALLLHKTCTAVRPTFMCSWDILCFFVLHAFTVTISSASNVIFQFLY